MTTNTEQGSIPEDIKAIDPKLVEEAKGDKLKDDEVEQESKDAKTEEEKSGEEEISNRGQKRSLEEDGTSKSPIPLTEPESGNKVPKIDQDSVESSTTTTTKEESVTPGVDQNAKADADSSKEKQPEKPKYVFGSSTSFGGNTGFGMFSNRKSIFDKESTPTDDNSEKPKTSSSPSGSSVFGGGSAFGNAFQAAMTKKSIFDKPLPKDETADLKSAENPDESHDKGDEEGDEADTTENAAPVKDSVYQKVHLEKKQAITTGEEGEETLFACKSKLYTLDLTDVKQGWKEKGVGVLRLNKMKDSKYRLLMRADAILKVILNMPVSTKTEVFKGMESSLQGEKFVRLNYVENDKPVQYALKFGQAENALKLYNLVEDLSSSGDDDSQA